MGFHTLAIGVSALLTARYGLDVTGQNLGNVDTDGYSRQRLQQDATLGWNQGLTNAVFGTGVWVKSVKRVASEFVEKQLRTATSTDNYYTDLQKCYTNIQAFFNEITGNALSDSMNKFWNSMSDLSAHVESVPIRGTVVSDAEAMVTRFNSMGTQLSEFRQSKEEEVQESVRQINRLLESIAYLNQEVVKGEQGGVNGMMANDLRDQRGEMIKELYGLMDIDVVEEANGSSIISIHGRTLVYHNDYQSIIGDQIKSDDMIITIPVFASDHYPLSPKDGLLAAQMEERDVIIKTYKDDLDQLAAKFIWEFNKTYSQTRGLVAFDSLTTKYAPMDPAVTLDKLAYTDLVPAGNFQIVNGNFEIIVHNPNTNEDTTVNIEVDLDGRLGPGGEPDMILWDPENPEATNSLIYRMQTELDKVAPGAFKVTIDRQHHVTLESVSPTTYNFAFGSDTSGVLAALGLNVLFTGHNAINMGVNQDLKKEPELLGAAKTFVPGDNSGVIDFLNLRDTKVFTQGMTLQEFHTSVVGRLASEASRTTNLQEMYSDIQQHMFVQRESLSGVSEDEETTKLITYQRSFQAAAKFISTVDIFYETLINM
ncbi:MAG: flagellar hook-associated protein FlgK [Planctomycetota bacterium]|jgi:flagellar hook-associated protein 1 FlgK|nr:flagellar hook-associated protein FlgK [Planctomycetota bacterium]